ncbi:MAG: hypothetical protein RRY02_09840 [Muribaculaceae bacterium]
MLPIEFYTDLVEKIKRDYQKISFREENYGYLNVTDFFELSEDLTIYYDMIFRISVDKTDDDEASGYSIEFRNAELEDINDFGFQVDRADIGLNVKLSHDEFNQRNLAIIIKTM